jgi:hypothetical protein
MQHPFGDLLTQYRERKTGLTQIRLATLAGYHPSLIPKMRRGHKELTGPSGRDRVIRLMTVLRDEEVLSTQEDANALLQAAGMPPLYQGAPLEAALLRRLKVASAVASTHQPMHRRHGLPLPLTRFVGREQQLAELSRLLLLLLPPPRAEEGRGGGRGRCG